MNKTVFFVLLLATACSKKESVKPTIKPLMEAVYASGFVVSDDEYQVFSQADGLVREIMVSEGSEVQEGAGILLLESQQQDARYRIAKESYDLAKLNAGLQSPIKMEAENVVKSARAKYQLDSLNFTRLTNLLKANATTRVEYDRSKVTYENSRNEWQSAQQRLVRITREVELAYRQAENQLQIAAEESGNFMVRSKIGGMVFKIAKGKGELVRRGELVAVVGKRDRFHLQLSVDELDANRLKEGLEMVVQIEAYPDQVYHGRITKIFPLIDVRQQSLRVDAALNENLPGWFSGLAVEANIILQQKENALVLPKALVLEGDSVMISTDQGDRKVKIRKGIETMEEVEILEGLTAESELAVKKP
jgi:HlyD family secretion protein